MPATALSLPPDRTGPRAFLGVERSVCGRPWHDRLDERAAARALAIAQRHAVPELLARILAGRGVEIDAVESFLDPSIRRLMPDPHVVTGMETAAARIAEAVGRAERIAIFGDYDVDGATSTALFARFLQHAGIKPDLYIPDRLFEGYGPNVEAVRSLAQKGARLLITVDCGTTSPDALAEAQRLGLETIVIDHHQADAQLPAALAVVNPNRLDDLSGLGYLAAAGLVFLVLVATNRALRARGFWTPARPEPDLLGLLDLVALGTVADVSRLVGLNRAFVAKGLIAMRRRERIGRADLGAQLLLTEDPSQAAALADELDRLNRERQAIEQATLAAAEAEAAAALGAEERGAVVVTAATGWHPGIVGLVAARLKERFERPAFAIALEPGGTGTGSGRSIQGVDLGRAVRRAVADGLLIKGGGHAMAAGVTLRQDRLAPFRAFLEAELAGPVEAARRDRSLLIDGAVTAAGAGPAFHAMIARAGPYGPGNPEPVFALPSHAIAYAEEVGQTHVRVRLKSGDGSALSAIASRAAGQPLGHALLKNRGRAVHAAGSLVIDRWQGEERVQLRLLDLAVDDPVARV